MRQFVNKALWEALKKEEEALLMEFLEADKDLGNRDIRQDFSKIEGEDFIELEDFDFKEQTKNERYSID